MIRAQDLTKRYGPTLALDRLSLEVPAGSLLGLLGPNGAGKTTFLRLAMGLIFPEGGQLDRSGLPPSRVGYLPERAVFPPLCTVREYLFTAGRLAGLSSRGLGREVARLLEQVELTGVAGRRLGACSAGMLQRVAYAQALQGNPPLLLLDEPMIDLDPAGQKLMRDQIVSQHQAGKTVVLCSHNLGEVARLCTHIAMLARGRLARYGPLESLLPGRPEVAILTGPMPAGLPSDLRALGAGILATEARVLLVGDAVTRKAEVLALLLQAGVDVRSLSEQRATLEEVYLEATRG
jgi:ABC-2 type transport system ATP-binding protein